MGFGEDTSNILRSAAEKKVNRPTPPLEKLRPKQETPAETHSHPDQKGAARTPLLERLLAQATQEAQDQHAISEVRQVIGEIQAQDAAAPKTEPKGGLKKLLHKDGEQDAGEKVAPVVKAFLNGEVPGKILSK